MSAQFKAAFARAAGSALLAALGTYATVIVTVEDDCRAVNPPLTADCEPGTDTKQEKAMWPAVAAAVAVLLGRGGGEGAWDTKRQKDGNVKDGDVKPKPPGT